MDEQGQGHAALRYRSATHSLRTILMTRTA